MRSFPMLKENQRSTWSQSMTRRTWIMGQARWVALTVIAWFLESAYPSGNALAASMPSFPEVLVEDPAPLETFAQIPPRVRHETTYHRSISDTELEGAVGRAAFQHRISPALLLAVMKAESSFNPVVVSRAGAVGLMQLVPETAIRHGVRNLYDTEENIAGGAKHLRYLLDRFHGKLRLALAAYNAGEGVVDRYGKVPPYRETSLYVKRVMGYYRDYKKGGWVLEDVSVPRSWSGRVF